MNQTSSVPAGLPSVEELAQMSPEGLNQLMQRINEAKVEKLLQDHANARKEYAAMMERVAADVMPFRLTAVKYLTMTPQQLQKHLLTQLRDGTPAAADAGGRPINRVPPVYRNPSNPEQTWTGRGNKPNWVKELLEGGGSLDSVRISKDEPDGSEGAGQKG